MTALLSLTHLAGHALLHDSMSKAGFPSLARFSRNTRIASKMGLLRTSWTIRYGTTIFNFV